MGDGETRDKLGCSLPCLEKVWLSGCAGRAEAHQA